MNDKIKVKKCPISIVSEKTCISKKWTLIIIRDLLFGVQRFTDFLKNNPNLSAKVLSERLKEMEDGGLIDKKIVETRPLKIQYELTQMGKDLNKILYELSMFGAKYFPQDVFQLDFVSEADCIEIFGNKFKLEQEYIDYLSKPMIETQVFD